MYVYSVDVRAEFIICERMQDLTYVSTSTLYDVIVGCKSTTCNDK